MTTKRPDNWGMDSQESRYARDHTFEEFSARYPDRSYTAYRVHRARRWGLQSKGMKGGGDSRPVERTAKAAPERRENPVVKKPAAPTKDGKTLIELARERLANAQQSKETRSFVDEHAKSLTVFDGIVQSLKAIPAPSVPSVANLHRRTRKHRSLVLLYSDSHCGLKVENREMGGLGGFNHRVWLARHDRLRDAVVDAQEAFQADELVVLGLGDLIDGQDIFKSQAYHIDASLPEQIVFAGTRLAEDSAYYAGVFPKVRHFYVYGNHGRKGRYGENPYSVNYEHVVYEFARSYCRQMKNVQWTPSDSWFQLVDILGTVFLTLHGDDIRSYGTNLASGMHKTRQQYMSMLNVNFDYLCAGHHHRQVADDYILANGSFVGASEFTAKSLASTTLPSQKLLVVEENHGLTWKQDVALAQWSEIRNVPIAGR